MVFRCLQQTIAKQFLLTDREAVSQLFSVSLTQVALSHGMEEARGSNPLSSTLKFRDVCAAD